MGTIKLNIALMAAFSFIVALLFLVWPNFLKRVNVGGKRWLSTRKLTKALDIERDIDDKIFNLSKPIGAIALVVALGLTYLYVTT